MMRSPSFGLRPVVSVSRTICRKDPPSIPACGDTSVGELVRPLVLRMAGVALHPMPLDLMLSPQLVELAPQVLVLHRLLVGGAPAAPLPAVDPGGDAVLDV